MENKNYAFCKINFILIGISMLIVVVGFLMMTGATSENEAFNPEIFSLSRISIAPIVCLLGFLSIIVGIMYHKKEK